MSDSDVMPEGLSSDEAVQWFMNVRERKAKELAQFVVDNDFVYIGTQTRGYSVDGLSGVRGGLAEIIVVHDPCGMVVGGRRSWLEAHLRGCTF